MRFRMTSACLLPVVLAFAAALQAESFSRKVDPWVLQKSSAGTAEFLVMLRTQGDLRGARALSSKTERSAFVMDALRSVAEHVAEAAPGSSGEPRSPAPVLLGRQHDLGPRRPQPRRGARGPRRRVPHLRQSERAPRRTGGLEPGGPGAVFPRRDRMGRGQGPRAGGLGARIHGRGHRRRRPGHRLRMGPSPRSRTSTAAGWASDRTTTTTGTIRSTPAAAPAAPTLPSRATTTPTARTRWARWSATTAAPTRSASRPGRSGSAAAT